MKSPVRADIAEWTSLAWSDLTAETIKKGYHRAHMRTGNLEVAASELIDELERLYIMENEIGEIDSDDDFDRSIIHLCLVGGLSCVAMCLLPLVFLGS